MDLGRKDKGKGNYTWLVEFLRKFNREERVILRYLGTIYLNAETGEITPELLFPREVLDFEYTRHYNKGH